jgi:hypothetical protein
MQVLYKDVSGAHTASEPRALTFDPGRVSQPNLKRFSSLTSSVEFLEHRLHVGQLACSRTRVTLNQWPPPPSTFSPGSDGRSFALYVDPNL